MSDRITQLREDADLIAPEMSRLTQSAGDFEKQLKDARVKVDVVHTVSPATHIDRLRWMARSGSWVLAYRVTSGTEYRFLEDMETEDPRVLKDVEAAMDGLVTDLDTELSAIRTDLGV